MKKFVSFLLITAMLSVILPFPALSSAADITVTDPQGVKYTLSDDGTYYIVSGFNEKTESLVIPGEIEGIPVKRIGNSAFYWCSGLESIDIPDSITAIGDWAFWNCSGLKSIDIPDSVTTIGESAFEWCGLTVMVIPGSVKSIGSSAFYNCSKLKDISVDANNTSYTSDDGVLFDKNKTELICFPSGRTATSYVIPDSVKTIGDDALYGCAGLENIILPEGLTHIGWGAFSCCSGITGITVPDSVTDISDFAFEGCTSLKSIVIPEGVKRIGSSAFAGWTNGQTVFFCAGAQPGEWDKEWAAHCTAKLVWGYDYTAFSAVVDMPEYYIADEILNVKVSVGKIFIEKLSYIEFSICYDASVLKLLNGKNSDGSLDFVAGAPEAWENLTAFDDIENGVISARFIVASDEIFPEDDGDIALDLRFEIIDAERDEIVIGIPRESVNGSSWDDPASILAGNGSSASSVRHLHEYACEKFNSEQHKYVCSCGRIVYETHDFDIKVIEPDCENGGCTVKTCKDCGEEITTDTIGASGHKPGAEATCTEDQVCMVCGKVIKAKLGHDYTAVVTKPTCEEKGYTTHTCSRCGDHYVDSYVDASGHTAGEWIIVKEPAIGVEGLKEKQCTVCGKTLESEVIPALKPEFVKGDVNGNGDVDAQDYALAKRYVLGTYTLTEEQIMRGDINGNGELEAGEYALIKRHVLGTYTIK